MSSGKQKFLKTDGGEYGEESFRIFGAFINMEVMRKWDLCINSNIALIQTISAAGWDQSEPTKQ